MGIERTARGNSKERNDPDNSTKTAHLKLGFTVSGVLPQKEMSMMVDLP
jgi:hypothetical protein